MFFWEMGESDPNLWPVVMWARGPATTYRFEGGMVEFLLTVFEGRHPASDWPRGPKRKWTMTSDWLRRGLNESSGYGTV